MGIPSAHRSRRTTLVCPLYFYYDHGTEHCENCRDICDKAAFKGTVQQCLEQCKAYTRTLPRESTLAPSNHLTGESAIFSTVLTVTLCICLSAIVLFAVILYCHKTKLFEKIRGGKILASSSSGRQQQPQLVLWSLSVEADRERHLPAGIQEQGKQEDDMPLLAAQQVVSDVTLRGDANLAQFLVTFLSASSDLTLESGPGSRLTQDLDSTELKTLQPTLIDHQEHLGELYDNSVIVI